MGVHRARCPAQHVERGLVAALFQHLGEVLRLRLRQQIDLDADAGEHADHGLADRGVADVAIVRAIHGDLEAIGVSRLGQELLGAVGIELPPREVLGRCEQLRSDHQRRRRRQSAHHARLDQLDVDRLVEGFADLNVLERIPALDVG